MTSLYTTAALVLALCVVTKEALVRGAGYPPWILIGLLYAGLLALKTTNPIFVAAHFALLIALNAAAKLGPRISLRQWGCTALAAFLAVLPWVVMHRALYLAAWGGSALPAPPAVAPEPYRALFSAAPSLYGASERTLALTVLMEGVIAGWLFLAVKRGWLKATPAALAATAAAAASAVYYLIFVGFLASRMAGQLTALRYCCPFLVATVPAALVMLAETEGASLRWRPWSVTLAAGGLIFALYLSPLRTRVEQMAQLHCRLAFLRVLPPVVIQANLRHGHELLQGSAPQRYRQLQSLVPAGEPIIAWTMAPFCFDFARNPIFNTDPTGLSIRRRRLPSARYIILQTSGFSLRNQKSVDDFLHYPATAIRMSGVGVKDFAAKMNAYRKNSDVLFDDGEYLVFRVRSASR